MPDIRDVFAEVETLDLQQLHAKREEILTSAPEGDVQKLSDDSLSELCAINRALRRKVAANAGERKRAAAAPKAPRAKKAPTDLEDLA